MVELDVGELEGLVVGSITGDGDGPELGCRVGDFDVGVIEGSTDALGVKLSV